jgi:hypothetical protein
MIDTTTQERLCVSTDGGASPYIVIPVLQLDKALALLDEHKVEYWLDDEVLSVDGKPEVAFVNLGQGSDLGQVQRLLDSTP